VAGSKQGGAASINFDLPPLPRLFFFAALLPAAIAVLLQGMLEISSVKWLQTWYFPTLILCTAVLSWCTGRYVRPVWMQLILFAWCLALLDLLTILAGLRGRIEDQFGYVLVSAEISLLVLWTVLGSAPWQWRLPAAAALAPLVIMISGSFSAKYRFSAVSWNFMMFISAPIMVLMCGVLRRFGFVLEKAGGEDGAGARRKGPSYQFGMKHILIWFTVSGPLLILLRSLDYSEKGAFRQRSWRQAWRRST